MRDETHWVPRRTVDPTELPVGLDQFKFRLSIPDDDSMDSDLTDLLWEAYYKVEHDSGVLLMPQTWQLLRDAFPCWAMQLVKCPVRVVNFVKYIPPGSTLTTWSSSYYQTDLVSQPARLAPVSGQHWPVTDCRTMNSVQIEWTAGYATAATVPRGAKAALLHLAVQKFYGKCIGSAYDVLIEDIKRFGFLG